MANKIEDMIIDDFTMNPQDNMFGIKELNVNTNIKDQISSMLVESLKAGKLDPKHFQQMNDKLKLGINMKFNSDYSLDFNINDYIGDSPVDYKVGVTKEF